MMEAIVGNWWSVFSGWWMGGWSNSRRSLWRGRWRNWETRNSSGKLWCNKPLPTYLHNRVIITAQFRKWYSLLTHLCNCNPFTPTANHLCHQNPCKLLVVKSSVQLIVTPLFVCSCTLFECGRNLLEVYRRPSPPLVTCFARLCVFQALPISCTLYLLLVRNCDLVLVCLLVRTTTVRWQ